MQPDSPYNSQQQPSDFERRFREYVVATADSNGTKKRKRVWPIVLIILLVLLGGGAGAYYLYTQRVTPEKRFALALENHLQIRYLGQDFEMKTKQADRDIKATIHSVMDISDIKNTKVTGDYTLDGLDDNPRKVKFVLANKKTGYIFYDKRDVVSGQSLALNAWYQYDPSSLMTTLFIDPIGVGNFIPMAEGQFIVGSFSDGQRQQLMQQLTTSSPYTIKSAADEGSAVHYVVALDKDRLTELNKLVVKMDESDNSAAVGENTPSEFDIWIDKSTNHFTKFTATRNDQSMTITLAYPTEHTVSIPQNPRPESDLLTALTGVSALDLKE